ncbi:MAG: hypothetical protein JOZ94_04590 [Xanthobacteraceae bacterium]|nr:hypothetical protein [Xanthobacteraceae bacterium]
MKRLLSPFAILAAALGFAAPAAAQDYPNKDIHVIVGFPAGSGADVYARYFANKLSVLSKQTVIVENKPGAQSSIATEYVARAKPDGYTAVPWRRRLLRLAALSVQEAAGRSAQGFRLHLTPGEPGVHPGGDHGQAVQDRGRPHR